MSSKADLWRQKTQQAFSLLNESAAYSQRSVVKKLQTLGFIVGAAVFNKIIKDKTVGRSSLQKAAEGMEQLVTLELGRAYNNEVGDWSMAAAGWKPEIVPEYEEPTAEQPSFQFHTEGRVPIKQKCDFFADAQKELVEVGVRLNTFTNYFISRNSSEYRTPIENLLKRGVNIKLYLLNPETNAARLYYDDRSHSFENEKRSIEDTKRVLETLVKIRQGYRDQKLSGTFEIYTYQHIPQNHFLIVDGESLNGKMMTSHYIYGIRRADCPVLEFTKKENRSLFRKYWTSYTELVKKAKVYMP